MAKTFFFYDLETSGLNPREDRIMQFAGIRTDENLKPVGEPVNVLVKLNDDVLPKPEAILVTSITPQATQADGLSEAEFARMLIGEVFTPDTTVVGFNNIRFDDEFIRYLFWRNFYDPYEWAWKDGRSRWDALDLVRMTRALRPEGISWPTDSEGAPINTLEQIAKANKIKQENAHDALSDVEALIGVTQLVKTKQPQLFDYLLKMSNKNEIKKLVNLDDKQPFVYTSGRYGKENNFTSIAFPLTAGANSNVIVYDLRYDPTPYLEMNPQKLSENIFASWEYRQSEKYIKIPVKELQYNRSPAIAPLGVLEQSDGWGKLSLAKEQIMKNREVLLQAPGFAENIRSVFENKKEYEKTTDPETLLYDGFVPDLDRVRIEKVRLSNETELADFHPNFTDERLDPLLLHYKARSYPKSLSEEEMQVWESWRTEKITKDLPRFVSSLQQAAVKAVDEKSQFILQELQLWAESMAPEE